MLERALQNRSRHWRRILQISRRRSRYRWTFNVYAKVKTLEQRSLADILSALSEVRSELSNLGEIGEKSVETVTARLSQSDTGRHRYGIGYQRIAHHIADVSESVFGFVILLSSFREQVPWLYEIGMEAHRRAANGDPDRARMAFDEMIRLMKVAERVDQGIPAPIVAELPRSFERMVRLYQNRSMSEELPW